VVDEASKVAIASSINNSIAIDTEQVTAADTDGFVAFFSQVGDCLTHYLTHVFYHHLALSDRLQCKQAPVVDAALRKLQLLLAELQQHRRNSELRKTLAAKS